MGCRKKRTENCGKGTVGREAAGRAVGRKAGSAHREEAMTKAMASDALVLLTGEFAEMIGIKEIAGFVTEMSTEHSIEGECIKVKIIGAPTENGKTIPATQFNIMMQQIAPLPTFPENKVIKTVGECLKMAHKILDEEDESEQTLQKISG